MNAESAEDLRALPKPSGRTVDGATRVVWALVAIGAIIATLDGIFTIQMADSAPQQAAGAAMSCFYLIAMYVFARSFDEVSRRR